MNLKSSPFVLIMLIHEGLTLIHSQKKPRLCLGESFTLTESFDIGSPGSVGEM